MGAAMNNTTLIHWMIPLIVALSFIGGCVFAYHGIDCPSAITRHECAGASTDDYPPPRG
jgi:hypothetical protein